MPRRRDDQTSRDPQQIIDDQARERLREDLKRSEIERQRSRRENERLKEDLEAARRHATRQAAPFSRRLPKAHPNGPAANRVPPTAPRPIGVDRGLSTSATTRRYPGACPACGGRLRRQRVVSQYHEDLPIQRPAVHEFRVAVGQCPRCQRRVRGRHPLQTSDALGAAAVHLGPQAVPLAVILNKRCGLSFARIGQLLESLSLPETPSAP